VTGQQRGVNARQFEVLQWISDGCPDRPWPDETYKLSATALHNRGLAAVSRKGGKWAASITKAGLHYLEHGEYPKAFVVDRTVDSPAGKRRRGGRPDGDALFTEQRADPYDEKVLVTVKEAAWMLSLPENAIRRAVSFGDLDRVFIGDGGKNYRIVYGSLLAWVNSMPRESARVSWWR
jgi:hypothetical protein